MKATVNGIETNYEIHGKEGAPWLAFSHSLACDLRMWDGQVEAFKDRFRILTYDTRGHGASAAPKGAYTLEQLSDDLHGLLAHLKIEKLNFCGLSMGGMIGQTFALKYPGVFEKLVLADTSSGYPAGTVAIWEERIRTVEAKGMGALVQSTVERWFTAPFRENSKDKVAKIAAQIERTPATGYIGCCHAIPRLALTARLKEIKCPTLVICGEEDGGTPPAMARTIQENIDGAKLVLIPKAAHISNIEQPEAFNRALREFL